MGLAQPTFFNTKPTLFPDRVKLNSSLSRPVTLAKRSWSVKYIIAFVKGGLGGISHSQSRRVQMSGGLTEESALCYWPEGAAGT